MIDMQAALERTEEMVDILRLRGFALDERAAERALAFCRSGKPDDEEEWQAFADFVGAHGQSLDWLLLGDPVSMISARGR